MRRLSIFSVLCSLIAGSLCLQARPQMSSGGTGPTRISLDGKWKLFYFPQGKYQITQPDQLATLRLPSIEASVPGDVALDLSRHGELPADLFFADNITKLKPYELYEWWYEREFPTPAGMGNQRVELRFGAVDCLATYWLNGKEIGASSNAFIPQRFDVTGKLRTTGPNVLTVRLKSPIIEAARYRYDPAATITVFPTLGTEGIWIRKPSHAYGWDIMPRAVSAGLTRSVELIIHSGNEITDMYFTTVSAGPDAATLFVSYELTTDFNLLPELELRTEGRCGDSTFTATRKAAFTAGNYKIEVKNPSLWWPRGYGSPNLYEVRTQLLHNGQVLASREDRVGIRTVELLRTDTTTLEKPGQFLFKVNGVPILCKGSNWEPADAFHSRDAERYERILALFIDLGCNMVRCNGVGAYEDGAFFDICDRNGIMVWQDFSMSCTLYPQTPEFQEVMRQEATTVVRKLRNHPSIALWAGDNEVDNVYFGYGLDPAHNKITREILPQVVFECDPYRPYLPSSPYMSPEVIATRNENLMPERHIYPRDYFKSPSFMQAAVIFLDEIGYFGCPGLSSIKRFVDPQHVWPYKDNPQWILHSTDNTGNPYRMNWMPEEVRELYGVIPDNIEDFIVASQVAQAEADKFYIEATRLAKWRRTGIVWWCLMDGWPEFSDNIVDYYFNKKLAYYYIKRIQQPVCVMVDEPNDFVCKVVVGNDSREDARGHYRIWDADSGETLLEGDYSSKANENLTLGKIPVFHADKRLLLIEWTANGKRYGNHYLLSAPPLSLSQYKLWLPKIAGLQNDFDPARVGE